MHFIRKINKNVQESFSIINEGIQITNGILEIKSVHLPKLLQLSSKNNVKNEESAICCIFEGYGAGRSKGVRVNDNNFQENRESVEPKVKHRLVSKLKFLHGENGGLERGDNGKNGVEAELTCSLGENCVLKRFSEDSYRVSVEFVDVFLKSLTRVLEDSSSSSRKVVENQSFLTLYEISQLYDAALVLKSQAGRLIKQEGNVESLQSALLAIVAQSLKLLNEILVYPSHIYFGNLNREYDDSKIERRKYDTLVKRRYPEEKVDEYELVGSFSFINVNEEEKKDLDEYLNYIDSILDASENAKQILESLKVTYDSEDAEWNEVFYGFLLLFQKIFSYNDVNWQVSQQDSNVLYFWNRYYDACSHYVYYEEHCYDCTKPKMDPDLDAKDDYCVCFLSTERCNFRVKVAVEDMMRNDLNSMKQLFGLLKSVKQLYIKSRLLEMMSQFTAQIEGFADVFSKQGALHSVFEALEECSKDHFYLLDTTLNVVSYEEYKPGPHLSLVNEKDLKIFMSFPPCTIEALMLIHSYVVRSRWHVSVKDSEILVRYAKNLVLVYTYYNCTHDSTKSMELLTAFSQVLHVTLESVLFAQLCVRDLEMRCEPFCKHIVEKLDSVDRITDMEARSSRLDLELCNMVTCSLVILMNLSKLGSFVEYQAIRSFTNYLSVYMSTLNGRGGESMVERLSIMRVNDLPQLYKCMLNVLYTKETQVHELEDVIKMKIGSFMDFESLPIFQLAVSLLDPYINTRVTSKFTREVFKLASKMGVFSGETTTGRGLKEYFSRECEELSSLLDQEFDDGKLVFYRKFVFNYSALLRANIDTGEGHSKVELLEEYGIKFVLSTMSKMISILKFKTGGNLENIFQYMLKALMCSTMTMDYGLEFKSADFTPLFELISMERNYGGHLRGVASVVLLYLFIVGFGMEENGVVGYEERVDLVMLSKMHEELNSLYFSKEFKAAETALKLDDIQPVDSLGLGFEESLRRFRECIANTTKNDVIELYYWNQNNFYNFSLPPGVFKKLIAFKQYLHPHLFGTISRCLSRFTEPILRLDTTKDKTPYINRMDNDDKRAFVAGTSVLDESTGKGNDTSVNFTRYDKSSQVSVHETKRSEESESRFHTEPSSNNMLDEPMKIMRSLYEGELEFAKAKLLKVESQLHILASSLQLSQMTNENMRNRIKLLEKQVEPSNEDNLDVELERERQRYCHLEQMYNVSA
ncbi:hypothetical protein MACK_000631 [Theileria orientalis]|uniref:Uncharacterized protein n=1 Tax=Theileria orientalis TaxID=68886 RepID=A0A976QU50_THEOR|nr:hypothetical protein MACK_000631 [Theileria orientalis]